MMTARTGRGFVPGRSGGARRAARPAAGARNKSRRPCFGGPHLFSFQRKSKLPGKQTDMAHHTDSSVIDDLPPLFLCRA